MAGPESVSDSSNPEINALLTGYKWDTTSISYSFPDSGWWYVLEQVYDDFLDSLGLDDLLSFAETFFDLLDEPEATIINALQEFLLPFADTAVTAIIALNDFNEFSAAQQGAAKYALGQYSAVANVTFNEVTEGKFVVDLDPGFDGDGVSVGFTHGVIRFAETGSTSAPAFGIPPLKAVEILLGNGFLGDTWYDSSEPRFDTPTLGTFGHFTIMHELGHAMGLKHGHESGLFGTNIPEWLGSALTGVDGPILPNDRNSIQYSIMTYRAALNGPDTLTAMAGNYAQSLMMLDIQAIQYMYGANFATNAGDTTYKWSSTSGEMTINGASNGVPAVNKVFLTIWDGNGIDTYDMSDYSTGVTIDLEPGKYSITSQAQRADLGGSGADQFALGNVYNALLFNGDTRSLIENATGGAGDDTISGNGAANLLRGGGGTDKLFGFFGVDTLEGGDGNDTLDGGDSDDTLNGDGGDDTLNGGGGNDTLNGGADKDTLNGGAGDDRMAGGTGDDTYIVETVGDQVIEGVNEGTDLVRTKLNNYVMPDNVEDLEFTGTGPLNVMGNDSDNRITGNIGDDVISGAGGNDTLTGNNGNDRLSGDQGNDILNGGAGFDLLDGGTGNDEVNGGSGNDALDGGDGNDTLTGGSGNDLVDAGTGNDTADGGDGDDQVSGGSGDDIVIGGAGNDEVDGGIGTDWVDGGEGNDSITGGSGADNLIGGDGDDTMSGGTDNDILIAGSGRDSVGGGSGDDIIDGGAGNDDLSGEGGIDTITGGDGDDTISGGDESDTLKGGSGLDAISGGAGDDNIDGGAGNDNLSGEDGLDVIAAGDGNDVVTGGADNDQLSGGAGDDIVSGGDGNDVITEGGGADNIDGGAGIDTVDYSNATLGVTFDASGLGLTGDATGDRLFNIEILIGTIFGDVLWGDAGNNTIYGLAGNDSLNGGIGNDVLDGGTGADQMAGGTDDDVYKVDVTGDGVTELAGQGTDRVDTTLNSYVLGLNVENLTFTGTGNFTGIGNTLANVITGNAGNDTLRGGAGADTLDGQGGSDTADYSTSATAVTVNLLTKANTGGDAAGDTLLNMENVTGSAFNDTLIGDNGDNVLEGRGGNDTLVGNGGNDTLIGGDGVNSLIGGAGNDTYVVSANGTGTITELAGGGVDTVLSEETNFTLGAELENLVFTGIGNFRGNGNDLANAVTGGNGSDILRGYRGSDVLMGLGGADTLMGGDGNDIMDGGAGADILDDNVGNDTFVFHAGDGGRDTVRNFSAGAGIGDILSILGAGWSSLADVKSHAVNSGASTIITIDATTSIEVKGVSVSQLALDDFVFV